MRVALLGCDDDILELAAAIAVRPGWQLVSAADVGTYGPQLIARTPRLRISDDWETLISGQTADVVLVARGENEEARLEQLRKLVQAGLALVLSHAIHSSMIGYFELEMIREESHARMLPYLPLRWHPAVEALYELMTPDVEAGIGALAQLRFERQLTQISESQVKNQFAADMDLARALAGDLTHLAALAPTTDRDRYAHLGVQLSGPAGVLVHWTVSPAAAETEATLVLIGSQGSARLRILPGNTPWQLEVTSAGSTREQTFDPWSPADAAIERIESLVAGESPSPDWLDACRASELADTIDRSLAKRKTIELYQEDFSEENTFKGTMAAVGCGMLMLGTLLLMIGGVAHQIGIPLARYTPAAILGLLVVFLLAQSLNLVFPRHAPAASEGLLPSLGTSPKAVSPADSTHHA